MRNMTKQQIEIKLAEAKEYLDQDLKTVEEQGYHTESDKFYIAQREIWISTLEKALKRFTPRMAQAGLKVA